MTLMPAEERDMIRDAALADVWAVVKGVSDKYIGRLSAYYAEDTFAMAIALHYQDDLIQASYLQRTHQTGDLQDVVEYHQEFTED